jgi:hypothetical protein
MGRQLGWVWFGGLSTDIYCIPANITAASSSPIYIFGKIDTAKNRAVLTDLGLPSSFINNIWTSSISVENKIYCIPTNRGKNHPFGILRTNFNTIEVTTLGTNQSLNNFFLNPVLVGTKIYCIPSVTPGTYNQLGTNLLVDTRAVIIDTESDTAIESTLGNLNDELFFSRHVANGNKIYSIPDRSTQASGVYKFGVTDAATNVMSSSTLGLPLLASSPQWFSAVSVGTKIYCVPYASSSGLFCIIDATTNTATTSSLGINASFAASNSAWTHAIAVGTKIYCIASLNNVFGIIDATTDTATLTTLGLPNQPYGWSSVVSIGTKIYCIPTFIPSQFSAFNSVAIIDTTTDTATLTDLGIDSSVLSQYPNGLGWATAAAVIKPSPA